MAEVIWPGDRPVTRRKASSPAVLAQSVRRVAEAFAADDENSARAELRELANEALVLSRMTPLPLPSTLARRVRIAAESDGLGRMS